MGLASVQEENERRQPLAPLTPYFEDETFDLDGYLAGLDAETGDFVRALNETGGAKLDLGPKARALCNSIIAETEHLFDVAERVQDAWRSSPAVRALALLPALREKLGAAYGRKPFAFQTLNFRRGTEQELHSDVIHFSSTPAHFMCGVWIALEDISAESGPLRYFPGSHRLPHLSMREAGVASRSLSETDYRLVWAPKYEARVRESGLRESHLLLKKGEAFVWAANLAHGGREIINPTSTRRSLVVHFYFDDCVYFAARSSDEANGKISRRLPVDIETGRWRWPRSGGRLEPVPPTVIATSVLRDLVRSLQARPRAR